MTGVQAFTVGIPRETFPGERRVALTPVSVPAVGSAGVDVILEAGAGADAGFPDGAYADRGARVVDTRAEVFGADAILQVRTLGANTIEGKADLDLLRPGQVVIGLSDAVFAPRAIRGLASRGITLFALELMPRIARAQGMDVLSSQATVAGYKAVLLAADRLPKMFPMLTTAAGTVPPAKVLVIGAGVAGLQAIATARRLGAVVEAYDVRPAAREEVESLGARFVELPLQPGDAEEESGYAKALGEPFYLRQQELLARAVAGADVVVTCALIPGMRAPLLVPRAAVQAMSPGSVIVDVAAERGGNCELTRPNEELLTDDGVLILGPTNLPATVPHEASLMYAKNMAAFLIHLMKEGELRPDEQDEIVRDTLVARDGRVVHRKVLEALGGVP